MTVNMPRVTGTLRPAGSLDVVLTPGSIAPIPATLIPATLSQTPFESFDLQHIGLAPLNRALPEFNTVRFS